LVNIHPRVVIFLRFLTLLTLVVVLLGAYTRLKDAGLGCPDWPGCYGEWVVPSQVLSDNPHANSPLEKNKAWLEMIHRYAAGTLGLLIFAFTAMTWVKSSLHSFRTLASLIALFVVLQALLGMWTVTWLLHPTIVMLHLLGGLLILSCVWLLQLSAQSSPHEYTVGNIPALYYATVIGLLLLICQIALGGWVSANYAALVCGVDFPLCQGKWIPPLYITQAFSFWMPIDQNFEGGVLNHPLRITIHMIHRIGAVVVTFYWLILSIILLQRHLHLKKIILVFWFLLITQITLGIINVMALLPTWSAVSHNGVAALLLLAAVTLTYKMHQRIIHERL
jgi:cytochrome c oxidase assembly protein subunit 15